MFLYTVAPDADIAALVPGGGIGWCQCQIRFWCQMEWRCRYDSVWQTANNAAFDYSKPMLGPDMKKQ
nr:hypothetical protein [Streptococcus equi]